MTAIVYESVLRIASGWDNEAGYSLVTALADSDSINYLAPSPLPLRRRGQLLPRHSGRLYRQSSINYIWQWQYITLKQIYKLDNDYQQTNDGKVTIRTIGYDNAVTNVNAYINFDPDAYALADNLNGIGAITTQQDSKSNWIENFNVSFYYVSDT